MSITTKERDELVALVKELTAAERAVAGASDHVAYRTACETADVAFRAFLDRVYALAEEVDA